MPLNVAYFDRNLSPTSPFLFFSKLHPIYCSSLIKVYFNVFSETNSHSYEKQQGNVFLMQFMIMTFQFTLIGKWFEMVGLKRCGEKM